MRPFLFAVTLGGLSACAGRLVPPGQALEEAALRASRPGADGNTYALAGFQALLLGGDASRARAHFETALERTPTDALALYGRVVLAERDAQPARVLEHALELLARAPNHPLSVAAARQVLELAGTAGPLDDLIVQRSTALLAGGLGGEAAQLLRHAVAAVRHHRMDDAARARALDDAGVPRTFSVQGPLTPYKVLSFDEPFEAERTGRLAAVSVPGIGQVAPRALFFADGRLDLSGDVTRGDGYLVAVDLDVADGGPYVVRSASPAAHRAYLDGTLLFERRPFERADALVAAQGVTLRAGKHRLLLRLSRGERAGAVSLALFRQDGQPSRITFSPALGPAPSWSGVATYQPELCYPRAKDLGAALAEEAGGLLSAYAAVKDGLGRDRDGAKRLAASVLEAVQSPAVRALRAELALGDPTVGTKVAQGRAARELEAALEADPTDVRSLLLRSTLALDDGHHVEALELTRKARAAASGKSFAVNLLQARIELALNVDAQAELSAQEALRLQGGLCEALALRYDLARRNDAVRAADAALEAAGQCPGAALRQAEHARMRADLTRAVQVYEHLVARDSGELGAAQTLAGLYVAGRRFDQAQRLLEKQRQLWPQNVSLAKRLAEVHELAGRPNEALALREEALALDGGDLSLRRLVERRRTGKELLADHAIDGKQAIASYRAQPPTEDTTGLYVLDAAAIQVFPDGSSVDRIHIIQKALDQSGVSDLAEVTLPPGAQVLSLRTVKADGTVLEPEHIADKDAVSLPGVQVGDFIEYEYLQANPPRDLGQPGFTAASFYFQIARQPNGWSTYRVLAPKGTGLAVDAHNTKAPAPVVRAEREEFFHEERNVPPYVPEPNSPPSANEYLPFVSVGAGATGNDGLVAAYADAYLNRGQLTYEVERFSQEAVGERRGLEAVRALYTAVMRRLAGRDAGLGGSASASLSQDRGSRLWVLKAALEAAGFRARVAAVRTFATDPSPYRFPNEGLLPYLCVRVEVPGEAPVWLDPTVRFGPFGELPEQAAGGREAYLLPEPGRPLEKALTPLVKDRPPKQVELTLELDAQGTLTGRGEETYQGFEAALLAEALEALAPDQRDQALQSALSRYFGGAELSELRLELAREVDAPLRVQYRFRVPGFARPEGERWQLGALTFPAQLGRRFVQLGSRRTPLYIEATESSRTRVRLKLPPGVAPTSLLAEARADSPFGSIVRRERAEGSELFIDEDVRLKMARVAPKQYDAFARFAGELDLLQAKDLELSAPARAKGLTERARPAPSEGFDPRR